MRAMLGRVSFFEIYFPFKILVLTIRETGSYLRILGREWRLKGKGSSSPVETISFIFSNLKDNPFFLTSLKVKVNGGFDDPFYSGILFGFFSAVSPFLPIENAISFERLPFFIEIETVFGIRVLKFLKILYNSYKRRK